MMCLFFSSRRCECIVRARVAAVVDGWRLDDGGGVGGRELTGGKPMLNVTEVHWSADVNDLTQRHTTRPASKEI